MFSTIAFRVFPIIYFPLSFIKQIGQTSCAKRGKYWWFVAASLGPSFVRLFGGIPWNTFGAAAQPEHIMVKSNCLVRNGTTKLLLVMAYIFLFLIPHDLITHTHSLSLSLCLSLSLSVLSNITYDNAISFETTFPCSPSFEVKS